MPGVIVCLICDSRSTFLRLRPFKLYACTECVKARGGVAAMRRHVPEYVEEFKRRHAPVEKGLAAIVGAGD